MKLHGFLESSLYVANLDASEAFYKNLFGFETLLADERMRALEVSETQILLLFRVGGSIQGEETPGGSIPPHDGRGLLHLAFAIFWDELDEWRDYLVAKGITIESEVQANAGYSLYFRDPDGHLIELGIPSLWSIKDG